MKPGSEVVTNRLDKSPHRGWSGRHQFLVAITSIETAIFSLVVIFLFFFTDVISGFIMAAYKLVLIRHGESNWNQENRFCGWFDADLSETGEKEARRGGQALKGERGFILAVYFLSVIIQNVLRIMHNCVIASPPPLFTLITWHQDEDLQHLVGSNQVQIRTYSPGLSSTSHIWRNMRWQIGIVVHAGIMFNNETLSDPRTCSNRLWLHCGNGTLPFPLKSCTRQQVETCWLCLSLTWIERASSTVQFLKLYRNCYYVALKHVINIHNLKCVYSDTLTLPLLRWAYILCLLQRIWLL